MNLSRNDSRMLAMTILYQIDLCKKKKINYSKEELLREYSEVINDFAKEHEALQLKAGIVEGKVAGLEDLKRYAAIPSRDMLLTMLAAGLMGTVRDLSICLDLYSKEKENN